MVKALRRVLVTREAGAASTTAARLAAAGFEPVPVPLQAMRRLRSSLPEKRFDLVAATSANALADLPAALADALAPLPIFCVGTRTAAAARAAGFVSVKTGSGTARALGVMIADEAQAGDVVAYLCGRVRKPDLEAVLEERGISTTPIETYAMDALEPEAATLRALADDPPQAALVYSVEGARALLGLLGRLPADASGAMRLICLSQEVARCLPGHQTLVACAPTEDALIAALGGDS